VRIIKNNVSGIVTLISLRHLKKRMIRIKMQGILVQAIYEDA
jgi:hypothetical protein